MNVHLSHKDFSAFPSMFFGEAIHAVFPFMHEGGDPLSVTPDMLGNLLVGYVPKKLLINLQFLDRVCSGWHAIAEYISKSQHVLIEPTFLGQKCIDAVLGHEDGLIELLEIKTFLKKKSNSIKHATIQLRATRGFIRKNLPGIRVSGSVLLIRNSTIEPFKVIFKSIKL